MIDRLTRCLTALRRVTACGLVFSVAILAGLLILTSLLQREISRHERQIDAAEARVMQSRQLGERLEQKLSDLELVQFDAVVDGAIPPPPTVGLTAVGDILGDVRRNAQVDPALARATRGLEAAVAQRLTRIRDTQIAAEAGHFRLAQHLSAPSEGLRLRNATRVATNHIVRAGRSTESLRESEHRALARRLASYNVSIVVVAMLALALTAASLALERRSARRTEAAQTRLHRDLQEARRLAEQASDAKSRFLAAASHDIRQPLHAMALYLASLERRVEGDEARVILRSMDSTVRVMTRLFSALLDLARLEAGVLKPDKVAFSISTVLAETAAQADEVRSVDGAPITVISSSLTVHTDPDLLEIVLRNLATNAVKHSRDGRVLIGCRRQGGMVRIEVHDTGPGIPDERVSELFGEFVRGEDAGSIEGIGLGLSIAQGLADLLGHKLTVRSQVGVGSVFAIEVPRAKAVADPVASHSPTIRSARILLADDEPLSLSAMRVALEDLGSEVTAVARRDDLMAHAEVAFDLYVFDLIFGEADGLAQMEEIETRLGRRVRGLVVTGSTSPDVLERLRASGRPWAIKPVSYETLAARVSELLADRPINPAP